MECDAANLTAAAAAGLPKIPRDRAAVTRTKIDVAAAVVSPQGAAETTAHTRSGRPRPSPRVDKTAGIRDCEM